MPQTSDHPPPVVRREPGQPGFDQTTSAVVGLVVTRPAQTRERADDGIVEKVQLENRRVVHVLEHDRVPVGILLSEEVDQCDFPYCAERLFFRAVSSFLCERSTDRSRSSTWNEIEAFIKPRFVMLVLLTSVRMLEMTSRTLRCETDIPLILSRPRSRKAVDADRSFAQFGNEVDDPA